MVKVILQDLDQLNVQMKKKFDEIFSATKYTKALEHIRKLKTEQTQLIRDYKGKVESLTIQKDHATKLRENFETARDKASDLTETQLFSESKISLGITEDMKSSKFSKLRF